MATLFQYVIKNTFGKFLGYEYIPLYKDTCVVLTDIIRCKKFDSKKEAESVLEDYCYHIGLDLTNAVIVKVKINVTEVEEM